MSRYLFLIAFLLYFFGVKSQTIVVKNFHKLETDQEARIVSPRTDQNGKKCAIIKVVTSQTGFAFDFGMIGNAVATEQKLGEIWVWVPSGARKVTINHQQLGVLRNYPFDIDIEEATVYEMVLATGKIEITVKDDQIASQWLVIKSTPSGADVYIDDQPANQTPYQNELPLGKHFYRISHDLYFPTAGSVVLTAEQKETLNLILNPDFGTLNISTEPENGASVSIDGQPTGKVTPCILEQIKTGEHTLTLRLNMYKTVTEKITIQAGRNHNLPFTLAPTFAEVTVDTNPISDIYIAGEKKGNGTWTGRLLPGIYLFEARKEKHTPVSVKREVLTGQPISLSLQPIPQNGILKVLSDPTDAVISLDGVNKGTTPNTIRNLLVGDHILSLSLPGYATINKTITITEGQTTQVNETLSNGREVKISSDNSGANLLVDGKFVGQTPYTGSLTFGKHIIKIEQNGKKAEKSITVTQIEGESTFNLSFEQSIYVETVNGMNIEMLFVQGGTFQMGRDYDDFNKNDGHNVTVSDFNIGKYEITQTQWELVMGNNPSNLKGKNFPVETVSWNEVQEFLRRLNAKTGKAYRLPTEAEWEFAAQGGNNRAKFKYSGSNNLDEVAWYSSGKTKSTTSKVGNKKPNNLGIYDMSGNVWEWCSDRYGPYPAESQTNPKGPMSGEFRVVRGGSKNSSKELCHITLRRNCTPNTHADDIGFRLAF